MNEVVGQRAGRTVIERALAGAEHWDYFPWSYTRLGTDDTGPWGALCTPNGRRDDGRPHTYWMAVEHVWEPHGELICEAVNAYVRDDWRGRLIRWLARGGRR